MTNHIIDNSANDIKKAVLWQYDKAVRLLSLMKHMHVLYVVAVEQFWKAWIEKILSIDSANSFGLNLWGNLVGALPITIIDENGDNRFIKPSVYKKILKGRFNLLKAPSTFEGILSYLDTVFGIDGPNNLTKWIASVSEYGWTTNVDELNFKYKVGVAYNEGFVFWYDESGEGLDVNWKCTVPIKAEENTSFDAIRDKVEQTRDNPTGSEKGDTVFLHLIDPEGYVRKIAAGGRDVLKLELSYQFGDYTITASATRLQKCGVSLVDNGDMSMEYVKTPYYDQMHRDQKALFEQRKDDVCPYPLGVKTNEPQETWIFGFAGQEPAEEDKYEPNKAYAAGTVVWWIEDVNEGEEYHGFHWKFKEDVTAEQNTDFDAIRKYVEKTEEGDPFVSGICDTESYDSLEAGRMTFSMSANKSTMAFTTQENSLLRADVQNVPTEFLVIKGSGLVYILDGYVMPIQMDVWNDVMSKSIEESGGTKIVGASATTISLKQVAFDGGRARSGSYYRAGTLMKLNDEYRYVKTGGTFESGKFSGKTVTPGQTMLKESY